MNGVFTDDAKAILLLCAVISDRSGAKPLTGAEYSQLARWLMDRGMRPADLLERGGTVLPLAESGVDAERLEALLGRGVLLAFALEKWQQAGIWIVTRSDPEYPVRYKRHLKNQAPPLLYGVGKRELLAGGGLALVGSRDVDREGERFTAEVAERAAHDGLTVISGGAKGVDSFSMRSALGAGGKVVGILAENLLRKSLSSELRGPLARGKLLLISPWHPDARFTVGTAMGRNKLIYALSDYTLVVSSDFNKGGTWTGAVEELRREHPVPLFVRTSGTLPPGNLKLLEKGARAWPSFRNNVSLLETLEKAAGEPLPGEREKQGYLFDLQEQAILSPPPPAAPKEVSPAPEKELPPRPEEGTGIECASLPRSAEEVLKASAKRQPLAPHEIAERIVQTGVMKGLGDLLAPFLDAAIRLEERRLKESGEKPRFKICTDGRIGLTSWRSGKRERKGKGGVPTAEQLDQIEPQAFRRLFASLLTEMGFSPDRLIQSDPDGGFWVGGVLTRDFIPVRFQLRILRSVAVPLPAQAVGQLSERLADREYGVLLRTGIGTREEEAVKAPPFVSLISPGQVLDLLARYRVSPLPPIG